MKINIKSIFITAFVVSSSMLFTSCASSPQTASASSSSSGYKRYPLSICLVTGNDLGSMGDEQRIVYQGQEMKFCCEPCLKKFYKDPAKYLAKVK